MAVEAGSNQKNGKYQVQLFEVIFMPCTLDD
jgi:hypothetical protein